MGKKMAGTNEFAFFRCKSICTGGGGPESGRKKFEKCLPAGTGTKIYFSRLMSLSKQLVDVTWGRMQNYCQRKWSDFGPLSLEPSFKLDLPNLRSAALIHHMLVSKDGGSCGQVKPPPQTYEQQLCLGKL